jgi:hypothetical protein
VLEQAAKQQQQFAPHDRRGVAHRGDGAEVEKTPSCLVDKFPAEVSFHAKGFLRRGEHNDHEDDSMGSFASLLSRSVGSVKHQKQLILEPDCRPVVPTRNATNHVEGTEVLFHAKGFLAGANCDDEDDSSVDLFAFSLIPSIGSVEQQNTLISELDSRVSGIFANQGSRRKEAA